jgi:hypothetical protein
MTEEEIEIIECGLVQLLIKNKQEEKQIETILEKLKKIKIEVIE